ncbi:hypothetical protein GW17_00011373 [Ensete ventricosum]|nr:hypothetical protein GW17_00011373 [Ensete ventricosum]RZS04299.1 hypothetical protein BHM03_00034612 [Ensete ventricosum]
MGEPESPPKPNPKKSSLCEECGSNPWKYRCPGCSILTCSLPCVKSHKERTSCTGKRNRTEFVRLSHFDDKLLISGQQLQNTVIVEYPVIYVFLPSDKYDFEVEKDAKSFSRNEEAPVSASGIPSPKGILFKEEEFEEGEMPLDTQVMDLMDCRTSKSSLHSEINKDDITSAEEGNHQDWSMRVVATKTLEPFPAEKHQAASAETKDHPTDVIPENLSQDDNFDFQQEIKDAYSDLMGEIDPDDFLCLDGVYSGGDEVETHNPPYFGDNFLRDEELEEGEIPSF